ncbi:MAG: MFS transporter, partial [Oscillospiraceae bacterium]
MYKNLSDKKTSKVLFLLCWLAYSVSYLGRLNFTAALAGMIIDNVFTKPQAGLIGTMFFMAYGVGQFINGFLGDKKSPFVLIFIGLSVSALANITMAFTQNYILMLII